MNKHFLKCIAAATIVALSACAGGNGGGSALPSGASGPVLPAPTGSGLSARIVGIGDSLTMGVQSNGVMGVSYAGNPISALPGGAVPATQENGFYALLVEQATGMTAAQMADPATSVLALINSPGLGAQLLPSTVAPPFAPTHGDCDALNLAAFSPSGFATVRANPTTPNLDLGIGGLTAHEALTMTNPLTGPPPANSNGSCAGYAAIPGDPTAGGLQSLLNSESQNFIPVLGGYSGKIGTNQPLTEVNVAVALRPTLTTVWLGANDLLKFSFSGGKAPSDTPAQMQADITSIVKQLQAVGSKVVVANIPDVLTTAQFFKGGSTLQATLTAFLTLAGLPSTAASAEAASATSYVGATYGVSANGYLTLSGFLATVQQCAAAAQAANFNCQPQLDPSGAGSGLGGAYLPDAFAAQVQALNTAYNSAIAAAATSTGAPLVDIHATVAQIAAAGGVPINPPKCCSLAFGGGFFAFDGLHPSNTGYALLANVFIQTIDSAFNQTIAPVSATTIYATDPYAPH